MNPRLVALLDRLNDATTSDTAWSATTAFFATAGFIVAAHGYVQTRDQTCTDIIGFRAAWPDWWLQRYEEKQYFKVDPSVAHCMTQLAPIVHHLDTFDIRLLSPGAREMYDEAKATPWQGVFVVPLRYRQDAAFGAFVAGAIETARDLRARIAEQGAMLYAAAMLADARLVRLLRNEDAAAVGLSPRERECLLCLSQGLRNDRIAERMSITNPTVEMHFANARRKLGAATRVQALAKAVTLGLVDI